LRAGQTAPILPAMSEQQLRRKLEELHRELSGSGPVDPGTRELLEGLLVDIQRTLERAEAAESHASLAERAETLAGEIEGSHPAVAGAIARVVEALANLGI